MKIKEKVLLIEDERTIRGFMQAILTANGYDVLMAGTGAMANTMISSHCPDLNQEYFFFDLHASFPPVVV